MTTSVVEKDWTVVVHRTGQPLLAAAGVTCAETFRGELRVDIQNGPVVYIPLAAITALMSAHAEWLKHTAEARKETAT